MEKLLILPTMEMVLICFPKEYSKTDRPLPMMRISFRLDIGNLIDEIGIFFDMVFPRKIIPISFVCIFSNLSSK